MLRNLSNFIYNPFSFFLVIDISSTALEESPRIPPFNSASLLAPRRLPPLHYNRSDEASRRSYSKRSRFSGRTKVYTVGELQLATNSFGEDNFLGEGSLGPVYRAVFPDGQVNFYLRKHLNLISLLSIYLYHVSYSF